MGINATGQIIGSYSNTGGDHGFLYSSGAYTSLDDPLANQGTTASGVNAAGDQPPLSGPGGMLV